VAVETLTVLPPSPKISARAAESLAVLGDSTAVGLGDPAPGGGWRGVGSLLAGSLSGVRYTNLSFTGARMRCVRERQLPAALLLRPDVVAVIAGMNDTLRSDFDPERVHDDLDVVVGALHAAGAQVLVTRFHDHGEVFRLPGPLRRALHGRIAQLNGAVDRVADRHGALCLDVHRMPGVYEAAAWSVDRLHPSERGHRLLARGFGELLTAAGTPVPHPVDLDLDGGRRVTAVHHVGWLVFKGVPWLCRRGRDLLPHAAGLVVRELVSRR
jgi:lysophospholipase L1-like esterase